MFFGSLGRGGPPPGHPYCRFGMHTAIAILLFPLRAAAVWLPFRTSERLSALLLCDAGTLPGQLPHYQPKQTSPADMATSELGSQRSAAGWARGEGTSLKGPKEAMGFPGIHTETGGGVTKVWGLCPPHPPTHTHTHTRETAIPRLGRI